MNRALIRHLRLYCASPNVAPVRHHDGILAVAGVLEHACLARLLLVDMERFGRNRGASVTNAIDKVVPVAHRLLIAGFGVDLADTLVVEWDGSGAFDLVCDMRDGMGMRHQPLFCMNRTAAPRRHSFPGPARWGARCSSAQRLWALASGPGWRGDGGSGVGRPAARRAGLEGRVADAILIA